MTLIIILSTTSINWFLSSVPRLYTYTQTTTKWPYILKKTKWTTKHQYYQNYIMFQFFVHLIKLLSISIKKSWYFSRTDKKCSDKAKYAKNMTNGLKSGPQGIFVNNIKIHCWKVTVSFLDFKIKHCLHYSYYLHSNIIRFNNLID